MKEIMPYMMKVLESDTFQEVKAIVMAVEHRCVIDRDVEQIELMDTMLNAIYYCAAKCENDEDVEVCIGLLKELLKNVRPYLQDVTDLEELEADDGDNDNNFYN